MPPTPQPEAPMGSPPGHRTGPVGQQGWGGGTRQWVGVSSYPGKEPSGGCCASERGSFTPIVFLPGHLSTGGPVLLLTLSAPSPQGHC